MKVKSGMGGSRNGKSRRDKTETLKKISKKARRSIDKKESIPMWDSKGLGCCPITNLKPRLDNWLKPLAYNDLGQTGQARQT